MVGGVCCEILSGSGSTSASGGDAMVGKEEEDGVEECRDGGDDEGENRYGRPSSMRVNEEGVENCEKAKRRGC